MKTSSRLLALAGAGAFAIAALSGCSAAAQFQEDACGVLVQEMTTISDEVKEKYASEGTNISDFDMQRVADAYGDVISGMEKTSKKISNEKVSDAFGELRTVLSDAKPIIEGWADDPSSIFADQDKYTEIGERISAASDGLQDVCPSFDESTLGT